MTNRESRRRPAPGRPTDDGPTAAVGGAGTEVTGTPARSDADHQELLAERDKLRSTIKEVEHTRTRATFVGLVIGVLILILLLVFILQNMESQRITLIFWDVNLPVGVSLLIAAIAGALITAMAGGARMFQLSRALKKAKGTGRR